MQVFADDADYASKATEVGIGRSEDVWGCLCALFFRNLELRRTLSTATAEHVAMAETMKEVTFLQQVWRSKLGRQ